jgi:nicotinamide riboside transporter PnuC
VNGPVEWIAAIGTIMAAALVAADYSRRVTGFGFVLFAIVSCLWVYSGLTAKDGMPLALQNGVLLLINLFGVWQFLISRKKKREIEKAEKIAEQAKEEVAQEAAA